MVLSIIANPAVANIPGAYARGMQRGHDMQKMRRENALAQLMQEQGPAILAGDKNALAQLAQAGGLREAMDAQKHHLGMDATRLGMDATRQSMTIADERLEMARRESEHKVAEWARQASAEERAATKAKLNQAMTVLELGGEAGFQQSVQQVAQMFPEEFAGVDLSQITYEALPQIAALIVGAESGIAIAERRAPAPLSPEGKLEADRRAGLVDPNAPPDPMEALEIEGKRLANEKLMRELAGGTDGLGGKDKFNAEKDLRSEYNKRVESFTEGRRNYSTIAASASDNTGAGDIALVTSFMKMLDPGSVVRETEFATARDTGGLLATLRGMATKIQDGQFLDPQQRIEFEQLARKYLEAAENEQKLVRQQMQSVVKEYGLSEDNVFGSASEDEGFTEVEEVEVDGAVYRVQRVD